MSVERWEEEKQVYIHKLDKIIDGIDKLKGLSGSRLITDEVLKRSSELLEKAKFLSEKLKKNEFEIAVVGLEKSGKSSFTNALIGQSALPTDDQRCTYTSTCIRWGDSNSADIVFYTTGDFARDFREKLTVLGIEDADKYSLGNLELSNYERLYEKCPENNKKLYEDSLNQDIRDTIVNKSELTRYIGNREIHYEGDQIETDEFRSFITSPGKAIAVKNVTIFSSELKEMPNAIIYDVPGFNSPTQMHREQTLEKMKNADAIIMVAKANEPSITGDLLQIFRSPDIDGESLSDKLFVFANKADLATDLQKNIGITYDEWITKRRIMPEGERSRDRFVFGSANAHLGLGTAAMSGLDDGIDTIRGKLEAYYKNERFNVLKKRINKIESDIVDLYGGLGSDAETSSALYDPEYLKIAISSGKRIAADVGKDLDKLKTEINTESINNRPLAKEISEYIDSLITVDKYTVTDEEKDKIHDDIAGIGNAELPTRFDEEIRKKRFGGMYNDFVDATLACTTSKHGMVCEKILEIFRERMNANEGDSWSVLKEKLIDLFDLRADDAENRDNVYYQSLIERFARDIYEILIKCSQGQNRHNTFLQAAVNVFSLGVFFNASTKKLKDDDKKKDLTYIETTPRDSMLWRILLYPEIVSGEKIPAVIDKIKAITGLDKLGTGVESLISDIVFAGGVKSISMIEASVKKLDRGNSTAVYVSNIKDALKKELDKSIKPLSTLEAILKTRDDEYDEDDEDNENTEYEKNRSKIFRSYDTVRKAFDDDIRALNCVMNNAVVPAANLDTAFSARETKLIEDIKASLSRDEYNKFDDFIAKNIELIEASKFESLRAEAELRNLDAAVVNEIREILSTISNASAEGVK